MFENDEDDVLLFADLNMDEITETAMENLFDLIDGLNADKQAKKEFLRLMQQVLLRPAFEGGSDAKHLGENLERVTRAALLDAADTGLTKEIKQSHREAA